MSKYRRGDHLRVKRFGYWHHGLYAGNNQVIHFSGEKKDKFHAEVRYDSFEAFAAGDHVEKVEYSDCNSSGETLRIAGSFLHERSYDLFSNNCEHFCSYCKTFRKRSTQIENGTSGIGIGAAGGLGGAATVGVLSAAGSTAGISTVAGVTSGLAATAGGLAAGVVATAALPATVTAVAANLLIDTEDPSLPEREREARKAAKVGATIGAIGGSIGAVAAVSAAGTTAGIGTVAGVTSGLAAVGGSLASGVLVTAAAPVAVAAAVGWLFYKLIR